RASNRGALVRCSSAASRTRLAASCTSGARGEMGAHFWGDRLHAMTPTCQSHPVTVSASCAASPDSDAGASHEASDTSPQALADAEEIWWRRRESNRPL